MSPLQNLLDDRIADTLLVLASVEAMKVKPLL